MSQREGSWMNKDTHHEPFTLTLHEGPASHDPFRMHYIQREEDR